MSSFPGKNFFCENFKTGLDSHDKLWYPVVTARLVKSNQGCETLCKGFRFLHSILSFSFGRVRHSGLLRSLLRGKGSSGTAAFAKTENKNGTHSLTTCVPRFLFYSPTVVNLMAEFKNNNRATLYIRCSPTWRSCSIGEVPTPPRKLNSASMAKFDSERRFARKLELRHLLSPSRSGRYFPPSISSRCFCANSEATAEKPKTK